MQSAGSTGRFDFSTETQRAERKRRRKSRDGGLVGIGEGALVDNGRLDPNPTRSCSNWGPTPPHTSPRERIRMARERLRMDQKSLRMARERLSMAQKSLRMACG